MTTKITRFLRVGDRHWGDVPLLPVASALLSPELLWVRGSSASVETGANARKERCDSRAFTSLEIGHWSPLFKMAWWCAHYQFVSFLKRLDSQLVMALACNPGDPSHPWVPYDRRREPTPQAIL